jgi:hypothetical protein
MASKPCPHCGKPTRRIIICGRQTPGFEPCDCDGYKAQQAELEAKKQAELTRRRAQAIRDRTCQLYDCSGLDKLFTDIRFEALETDMWNTEAITEITTDGKTIQNVLRTFHYPLEDDNGVAHS